MIVTQPAFSMAPALYSGTNNWSYFANGKAPSNSFSKNRIPALVQSNRFP